jgi:hypothetical protein
MNEHAEEADRQWAALCQLSRSPPGNERRGRRLALRTRMRMPSGPSRKPTSASAAGVADKPGMPATASVSAGRLLQVPVLIVVLRGVDPEFSEVHPEPVRKVVGIFRLSHRVLLDDDDTVPAWPRHLAGSAVVLAAIGTVLSTVTILRSLLAEAP